MNPMSMTLCPLLRSNKKDGNETMKTAKYVKTIVDDGYHMASLYKLSEPVRYTTRPGNEHYTDHVYVSSLDSLRMRECYIFPADEDGKVLDWLELEGSMKGVLSHEHVLDAAGYTLV